MGLRAVLDSLDGLDQSLHNLYHKGDDGKFYLDLEDVDSHPRVSGLVSTLRKYKEVASDATELKKKLDDAAKAQEKVRELEARLKEAQENAGKNAPDIEALKRDHKREIEELQRRHQAELAQRDQALETERATARETFLSGQIAAIVAKHKGIPDLLEGPIRQQTRVERDDKTGQYRIVVIDRHGVPRIKDAQGSPFTIEDLVLEMRKSDTFGRAFEPEGGSGSGTPPGSAAGGTTGSGTFNRNDPLAWGRVDLQKVISGEVQAR